MQLFRQFRHGVAAVAATALALAAGAACSNSTSPADSPVAAVVLSDTAVTLRVGDEAALTARATQVGGSDLVGRPTFWSIRDSNVASVSQSGVIKARGVGTTQVAASIEGQTAVARVTVLARPVTTVQVEPATVQLVVGSRQRVSARALNDAGAPVATAVAWTSETPAVVSVSADGEVAALTPGVGSIRATVGSASATAAVVVTPVPVARVAITPATGSIVVGATQQLAATATDAAGAAIAGRSVSWSSRDPGVAVVSSAGQVTGIAVGTAAIVATVDGQSATAIVTVRPVPVAAVRVTPDNTSVGIGGTVRLGAVITDAADNTLAGRAVSFESDNSGVARVAEDGTVTGVAAGTATISAISEGVRGTATVRVTATPPAAVASVEVAPSTATLTLGQTRSFTATPRTSDGSVVNGRTVTWSTGASSILTVSGSGVVTAVGEGTAQVLAQVDGVTGTATITVRRVAVASVQLTPGSASINAGATAQFAAQPRDAGGSALNGRTITWSSSNETVATVTSDGRVLGTGPGTATIRATSEGVTGTATVTVAAVFRVTPSTVNVRGNGNNERTAQLVALDHTGPVPANQVTWSSSNAAAVTVDANGVVRGQGSGKATVTITATYRGATATATVVLNGG